MSDTEETVVIPQEHLDAWERDQLDPDNWFKIPEFGVSPQAPDFVGFGLPIVTPGASDYQSRVHVRGLIRLARRLAQKEFKTLKELREEATNGWSVWADGWNEEGEDSTATPSPRQSAAMIYQMIEHDLPGAFNAHREPEKRFEYFAHTALFMAEWAAGEVGAVMTKAFPRRGQRSPLDKTKYYETMMAGKAEGANRATADAIFDAAPRGDDGKSPFYWDDAFQLVDRSSGEPITLAQMTSQIQTVRARLKKRTDKTQAQVS